MNHEIIETFLKHVSKTHAIIDTTANLDDGESLYYYELDANVVDLLVVELEKICKNEQ